MRDLYIKNGQGFIIVYSLTSKQSFQDIKLIRDQIIRVKGHNKVPIVLAANKCDLVEPFREVSTEEGFELANEWSVPYVETSAKNSTIVNSLFTEIVKEMNIKSNNLYGNSRKDKKKLKKLTSSLTTNHMSNSLSSNSNSKSKTLSNHSSSSYSSSATKQSTITTMHSGPAEVTYKKPDPANGKADMTKKNMCKTCLLSLCCCCCSCLRNRDGKSSSCNIL